MRNRYLFPRRLEMEGMRTKSAFLLFSVFLAFPAFSPAEDAKLVYEYVLKIDDRCHTQGIEVSGDVLHITCVAKQENKAYLYSISLPDWSELRGSKGMPISFNRKDLTRNGEYHPSGIDAEAPCLWVAVAEYHPAPATSTLMCLDIDSLNTRAEFSISDHIGAVAASSERIFGANWDSRKFYVWDWSGNEKGCGKSPTNVAYQDCKYIEPSLLLCGGVKSSAGLSGKKAFLDLIEIKGDDVSKWKLKKRVEMKKPYLSAPVMTNEGVCHQGGRFFFLPGDFPNPRIYEYEIKEMELGGR